MIEPGYSQLVDICVHVQDYMGVGTLGDNFELGLVSRRKFDDLTAGRLITIGIRSERTEPGGIMNETSFSYLRPLESGAVSRIISLTLASVTAHRTGRQPR